MDFWLEDAAKWNQICPRPSKHQDKPAAAACGADNNNTNLCFSATDIMSPGTAQNTVSGPGQVQGAGCKKDGGPLWISIVLEDDPIVAKVGGGATYAHTIWTRFYQKLKSPIVSNRSNKRERYQ